MKKRVHTQFYLLLAVFAMTFCASAKADSDVTAELASQNTPEGWTTVQLPNIVAITSANTIDISSYGASTSSSDNASAIQAAINAVPSTGGMVVVPAGTWLSGPITVKSNMVLHLSAGATLKLLPYGTYPSSNEYQDYRGSYTNFISTGGATVNDIIIEGEGETSVIDGQGADWWKAVEDEGKFTRPSLIRLQKGARHLFRNIKLLNSPGTNLTLGQNGNANNITVHDVTISAPASTLGAGKASHNTDGIPVWGPYVNIYDCNISTGDDNVVVDTNGRYVHAWNIICGSGHGMSVGSYTVNVHHVIFEDITFNQTETGFRIKTSNDRSGNDYSGTSANGAVHDLIFRNSTMTGVRDPIIMTCLYDSDPSDPSSLAASEVTATTPEFRDILFQNIVATDPVSATGLNFKRGNSIYIYGRPESLIHDITFDNVSIDAQKGMFMAYCEDINFINGCQITNTAGTGDFSMQYEAAYTGSYESAVTVMLSQGTCNETSGAASPWSFAGGYRIANANNKTYATSGSSYIKYSSGVQYTVSLPAGIYVKAVRFDGFDNYTEADAYLSEVNGTVYDATQYVFPQDKSTVSRKVVFSTPISGSFTFTPAGKQICTTITLYTVDAPEPSDLVLTDDANYVEGTYDAGKVTYSRPTTTNGKYGSFCLPFDFDLSEATCIDKAYVPIKVALYNPTTQKLQILLKNATGTISAGTPFIALLNGATSITNSAEVTFTSAMSNPAPTSFDIFNFSSTSGALLENDDLTVTWNGSYVTTSAVDGMKSFNTKGDFGPHSGSTIAAFRAYIVSSSASNSDAIDIELVYEGATSVYGVVSAAAGKVDVYSAEGRMVRKQVPSESALDGLAPGVYVISGKKYVK